MVMQSIGLALRSAMGQTETTTWVREESALLPRSDLSIRPEDAKGRRFDDLSRVNKRRPMHEARGKRLGLPLRHFELGCNDDACCADYLDDPSCPCDGPACADG